MADSKISISDWLIPDINYHTLFEISQQKLYRTQLDIYKLMSEIHMISLKMNKNLIDEQTYIHTYMVGIIFLIPCIKYPLLHFRTRTREPTYNLLEVL